MILLIAVLAATYLSAGLDSSRQIGHHSEAFRLKTCAETAISLAVHEVWSGYLQDQGGESGPIDEFHAYLDNLGVASSVGVAAPTAGEGFDLLQLLSLPTAQTAAGQIAGVNVDGLWMVRRDAVDSTQLFFTATVRSQVGDRMDGMRKSIQQGFVVEGSEWRGLDYALLANNVNCIMCHARIDSVDRYYNLDPGKFGTSERVKVGTLESIMLRTNSDTHIAGTLYVRGHAMEKTGALITDWSAMNVKSMKFDVDGHVIEDMWGNPTIADLVPAGDPAQPGENLYLDYATDAASMVDGYLPETFPPPFPDDGGIDVATGNPDPAAAGNRVVDPSEFHAVASGAEGSLAGGTIYVVPAGGTIDTSSMLSTALGTGNQPSLGSITAGNVILTGTVDNPILLDGEVAIDGDLIIQGHVKGKGSLRVSGNTYIPSDLVYMDGSIAGVAGTRTFGYSSDGTENSLAIATGGSIIAGNLFNQKKGGLVTGEPTGDFSFVLSEVTIFNRQEWARTQPLLQGSGEDASNPATWTVVNPDYKGVDYVPRYYAFTEGGTVPIFNKGLYFDASTGTWIGKEHVGNWDSSYLTYADPNDPTNAILYNPDGTARAAIHSLTGTGTWITDAMLKQLMEDAIATRSASGPLEVNGLLYTNNSIYGLVPKSSPMAGQMILNGAIVAADVGMLVSGGLFLNYDRRVQSMLRLEDVGVVGLKRKLWVGVIPSY